MTDNLAQLRTAPLPAPMSIARLLDKSISLMPAVFKRLLVPYIAVAMLAVLVKIPLVDSHPGAWVLLVTLWIALLGLSFILPIVAAIIAGSLWLGIDSSFSAVLKRLSPGLVFRYFALFVRISFVGALFFLLLVIPGLVYWFNRMLAPYIFLIERCSASEALATSKRLVGRNWLSLSGPPIRATAIILVLFIVALVAGVVSGGAELLSNLQGVDRTLGLVAIFVSTLIQAFIGNLSVLAYVGFYYDLRARYEGVDLMDELGALEPQPIGG